MSTIETFIKINSSKADTDAVIGLFSNPTTCSRNGHINYKPYELRVYTGPNIPAQWSKLCHVAIISKTAQPIDFIVNTLSDVGNEVLNSIVIASFGEYEDVAYQFIDGVLFKSWIDDLDIDEIDKIQLDDESWEEANVAIIDEKGWAHCGECNFRFKVDGGFDEDRRTHRKCQGQLILIDNT